MFMGGAEFCRYCLFVSRIWHYTVLGKSPTFIGIDPGREKDK